MFSKVTSIKQKLLIKNLKFFCSDLKLGMIFVN